nr:MAG TPA: hypothetical protein [Caudoviricetes sp.]
MVVSKNVVPLQRQIKGNTCLKLQNIIINLYP